MIAEGDVGGAFAASTSGIDFPSKRFEVTKEEPDAVVPFGCPFDSFEASEYPR